MPNRPLPSASRFGPAGSWQPGIEPHDESHDPLGRDPLDGVYAKVDIYGQSFVTMEAEAVLTAERVLTAGSGITILDNGANGTVVISVSSGAGGAGYAIIPFGSETIDGHEFENVSGSTAYTQFGTVTRLVNPDDFDFSPLQIAFEVSLETLTAGKRARARLWDVTDGVIVGTAVETLSTTPTRVRSGLLTLDSADHVYRIEHGGDDAGSYVCYDAVLLLGGVEVTAGFNFAILQMLL